MTFKKEWDGCTCQHQPCFRITADIVLAEQCHNSPEESQVGFVWSLSKLDRVVFNKPT